MSPDRRRAARKQVDSIRRRSTPVQNHIIDEYEAGKITRRQFIRRATILGMSVPVAGFLASACTPAEDVVEPEPEDTPEDDVTPADPDEPATLRVGFLQLGGPLDPVLVVDEPRLALLGQTASYLIFSDSELNPRPQLAERWEPNDAGDEWTFHLRQGVTYHDGTEVTADDVVASFRGLEQYESGAYLAAAGTFGVTGDGVEKVDDYTVRFSLEAPNGALPFFVSSDNYNAVVLPAAFWEAYEEGSYEQDFPGTGPWVMERYEPGQSAAFVKNENYFEDNARQPDRLEVSFFAEEAPMVTAYQEGRIDVIAPNLSFAGGTALIDSPDAVISNIPTAQHRQIYFDTSRPPFDDNRVRQAVALSLNRQALIDGLMGGFGVLGNDHPIWEVYPMFDPGSVDQREVDLAAAQQLLEAAGYADGLSARLDTLVFRELEDLATLVQTMAREIGVDLEVSAFDDTTYYSDYWLAAEGSMGIVNYGHRGVPNVYLSEPLLSEGTWNASHWANEEYDQLFSQFAAAPDLDTQRQLAGQIQALLWEEVPFAVPYFLDNLAVTRPGIEGLEVTGMGHVYLVNTVAGG
jgi:peptide/nickel transport system substrate-binding protein